MNNRAEMLRLKMEQRKQEQQLFTIPPPSKCKDYGVEYQSESGKLRWWERGLIIVFVVSALVMCWMIKPD